MNKSEFNPKNQEQELHYKVAFGLERLSEVFKRLFLDESKKHKLSPIQIQILLFIAFHKEDLCTVTHLAKEFNLTKATVSDAVRVLNEKKFTQKNFAQEDSRSYTIQTTSLGDKIVNETSRILEPVSEAVSRMSVSQQNELFSSIVGLIQKMNQVGLITVQRSCYACSYLSEKYGYPYCNFMEKQLNQNEIRLDCPEFEPIQ